jgi:signal transduction histidine kinase
MFMLTDDRRLLNLISTYKGWFYVLMTGWLLYLLVRKELRKRNAIEEQLMIAKEKAEESEKLKSAFLNNISHEIRTPLNAIIGFSELIINPDLTEEQKATFSAYIKRGSNDLVDSIEDILIVSRIQIGQVQLEENSGNVIRIMKEMVDYHSAQLKAMKGKENVELKFDCTLGINESLINADFRHLKQILNQLLGNAIKFTDNGIIFLKCSRQGESELIFNIKDTGCGIPESKQPYMFDPFRQAEETTLSRKVSGTGLGLSIAKGLVELMHGKIWLESTEGKGSSFFFTIPYKAG